MNFFFLEFFFSFFLTSTFFNFLEILTILMILGTFWTFWSETSEIHKFELKYSCNFKNKFQYFDVVLEFNPLGVLDTTLAFQNRITNSSWAHKEVLHFCSKKKKIQLCNPGVTKLMTGLRIGSIRVGHEKDRRLKVRRDKGY